MASEMTYTRCSMCKGTLEVRMTRYAGDGMMFCPCTASSTPGWSPTGVTLAQLERMADRERALAGDPGLDALEAQRILDECRRKLASVPG